MTPLPLAHQVPESWRAQAAVFDQLFTVFLVIGTLVGAVVVLYTLHHAYKYRDTGEDTASGQAVEEGEPVADGSDRPVLGELPRGQDGKGRKLFLSFGISAIIVISLVVYSYGLLLYVESGPSGTVSAEDVDDGAVAAANETGTEELQIDIEGYQFGWEFRYPNGHTEQNTLRVPRDTLIRISVTSRDVWHNFGVPAFRVKSDAIPGETTRTWFYVEEPGEYQANCYELCGVGHSQMKATVVVMEPDAYQDWYDDTEPAPTPTPTPADDGHGEGGGHGG